MQCSLCGLKCLKAGWSLFLNKPVCDGCVEAMSYAVAKQPSAAPVMPAVAR